MGQLHDSRYRKLHQQRAVMLEWARYVSQTLGLGEVDPDSLDVHTTAYTSDSIQTRLADMAWIFRTERAVRLLLLSEYQSTRDPVLRLRQLHYALGQLLAGYEAGRFRVRGGIADAGAAVAVYGQRAPRAEAGNGVAGGSTAPPGAAGGTDLPF